MAAIMPARGRRRKGRRGAVALADPGGARSACPSAIAQRPVQLAEGRRWLKATKASGVKFMLVRAVSLAALALSVLAAPASGGTASAAASAPPPGAWVIGPFVRGRNYSKGVPLHPTPRRDGSW